MISLLDTSAVLAYLRDEAGADRVAAIFDNDEVLLSTLTLAELARRLKEHGLDRESSDARMALARSLATRIIPVDEDVANAAFDVYARTPKRLPLVDSLIAATAIREGARLVHRDRHMAAIPAAVVDQLYLDAKELSSPAP